jgi:hypothetical protein
MMLLVGLTARLGKPLRSLLIAYCLLVFGATLVTCTPNRITSDQLCVRAPCLLCVVATPLPVADTHCSSSTDA